MSKEVSKWVGISGSWRVTNPEIENNVRTSVRDIINSGGGIVTGGALNVDYQATDEVRKLDALDQLKIFLPVSLDLFVAHYRRRAGEGVVTQKQADDVIEQLTSIKKQSPDSIIENMTETVVDKDSYYRRNSEVVNASDELLAFQVNQSQGTQDTIDKARIRGIPVKVFSYQIDLQ
jgi:predicted AlkP superfamily phosphohydrolase/phosphomutase